MVIAISMLRNLLRNMKWELRWQEIYSNPGGMNMCRN